MMSNRAKSVFHLFHVDIIIGWVALGEVVLAGVVYVTTYCCRPLGDYSLMHLLALSVKNARLVFCMIVKFGI